MGTWGSDIFEDDSALNELALVKKHCISRIRACFEEEMESDRIIRRGHADILANVDILCTLCRHYHTFPDLKTAEVEQWQQTYLKAYDEVLPDYDDYDDRTKREIATHRAIIIATFYRLLRIIDGLWDELDE